MRLGVVVLPDRRWTDAPWRWRALDDWGLSAAAVLGQAELSPIERVAAVLPDLQARRA